MVNPKIYPIKCPEAMRPLELLAPAGGLEAGYAAIHYGADAIYLGLPRFSARAEAANFSFDDVAAIIGYAHSRKTRRRVYVTINTLIQEGELDQLVEALAAVAALGVDAVIVQDFGVCRILRRHFPELRLHASTQMAIHNQPGVALAREMGFARVTLARELTLEELAAIAVLPGIETEVFVHGALCYGYSGLCLYSSHMLGRSGNRGRCAYLCRDQYRWGAERRFVFSMKDLALPEFVPQLRRAGVTALKIEGRMKNPLYVAAVVNYYRQLIDGALTAEKANALAADIKTIFSRPWTNLFLPNRWNRTVIEPDYVGHRGHPVGKVEEIVRLASGEVRLRFHTAQPLEVRDGIQMDVPGLPRPYGFAVERLRVLDGAAGEPAVASARTGLVFEAPAGALVEVALPGDHPDIPEGAVVYCGSSQEIKRRYRFEKPKPGLFRPHLPVAFDVHIQATGVQVSACLSGAALAGSITVKTEIPGVFSPARDAEQMRVVIEQAFNKLGATRFAVAQVTVQNPGVYFVPVSLLNQVRRQVTDQLEARYQEALSTRVASIRAASVCASQPAAPQATVRWHLKTDEPAWLETFEDTDWQDVEEVVLEMPPDATSAFDVAARHLAERVGSQRLRMALPVIMRRWEQSSFQKTIRRLVDVGWRKWQVANLGAWGLLRKAGVVEQGGDLDIAADWPLFVLNHLAAEQLLALGATSLALSPEDDGANMRSLVAMLGDKAVVIVYQDTPLMISEVCVFPAFAQGAKVGRPAVNKVSPCAQPLRWDQLAGMPVVGCDRRGTCQTGEPLLTSSFGEQVRVIKRNCRMVVIHEKPFCLATHVPTLVSSGVQSLRADFMYRTYTADNVREIWRRLRTAQVCPALRGAIPGTHTGNFERGLR